MIKQPVDVPHVDGAVEGGRDENAATGQVLDVLDHVRVSVQRSDLLCHVANVPQADRLVVGTCRKHPTVHKPGVRTNRTLINYVIR